MINTTVINIKTDSKVKKEAQKVAADLGLSLSGVINGFLKQFVRTKTVIFTMDESIPSKYLLSSIKSADNERRRGDFYSFKSNKEAIDFLDNQ
jgi:DNA-damage-inducible protein J